MKRPFWQFLFLFPALLQMVFAWLSGNYVPSRSTLLKIGFACFYMFFVLDFIPDFIPVAGWLDDAAVWAFVLLSIKEELRNFSNQKKTGGFWKF